MRECRNKMAAPHNFKLVLFRERLNKRDRRGRKKRDSYSLPGTTW